MIDQDIEGKILLLKNVNVVIYYQPIIRKRNTLQIEDHKRISRRLKPQCYDI